MASGLGLGSVAAGLERGFERGMGAVEQRQQRRRREGIEDEQLGMKRQQFTQGMRHAESAEGRAVAGEGRAVESHGVGIEAAKQDVGIRGKQEGRAVETHKILFPLEQDRIIMDLKERKFNLTTKKDLAPAQEKMLHLAIKAKQLEIDDKTQTIKIRDDLQMLQKERLRQLVKETGLRLEGLPQELDDADKLRAQQFGMNDLKYKAMMAEMDVQALGQLLERLNGPGKKMAIEEFNAKELTDVPIVDAHMNNDFSVWYVDKNGQQDTMPSIEVLAHMSRSNPAMLRVLDQALGERSRLRLVAKARGERLDAAVETFKEDSGKWYAGDEPAAHLLDVSHQQIIGIGNHLMRKYGVNDPNLFATIVDNQAMVVAQGTLAGKPGSSKSVNFPLELQNRVEQELIARGYKEARSQGQQPGAGLDPRAAGGGGAAAQQGHVASLREVPREAIDSMRETPAVYQKEAMRVFGLAFGPTAQRELQQMLQQEQTAPRGTVGLGIDLAKETGKGLIGIGAAAKKGAGEYAQGVQIMAIEKFLGGSLDKDDLPVIMRYWDHIGGNDKLRQMVESQFTPEQIEDALDKYGFFRNK